MSNLWDSLGRLRQNAFLRHNMIFFVGSVAVGALNYLYYPILGRMLSPTQYGEVQALVSFFLQLSIFLTVLGLVTVNIAANYDDEDRRNRVIFELERMALLVSIGLLVLSVIFSSQLKDFFRFNDALPFVVLVLAVVVTVPFTFRGSYIRGRQGFGVASIASLLASIFKIMLSVALVAIGLGTVGAIWGVVGAQLLALIYVAYWAKRMGLVRAAAKRWGRPDMELLRPELKYAGLVLVTSLVITLQFSVDILVVKHYFDAHTAGLYAGIATVARIIFFLTGSISQVLMPSVKLKNTPAQNHQLLKRSLYLMLGVSMPVLALFMLAPEWTIGLLMGAQYTQYAHLLPLLSMAIFAVAMVNLVVSYYMALRRYIVAIVVVLGGAVTYGLMFFYHSSLENIVGSLLIGSVSIILLMAIVVIGRNVVKQRGARSV